MKSLLPFVILLVTCFQVSSQNLVPNHSFEELRNLPVKFNPKNNCRYEPKSGFVAYQRNLNYWFAGSKTTPDLRITSREQYNECRRKYKDCNLARTGENAAGIVTYMIGTETDTYREYLQIKLTKPLKAGVKTNIQFWVSKDRDAKLVSNNIGCYFSVNKIFADIVNTIKVEPHLNFTSIINEEKQEWVKIEGSFTPEKAYGFLSIGNFFDNHQTELRDYKNYEGARYAHPVAYYMVDDVYVWQESDTAIMFNQVAIKKDEPVRLDNIEFDFNSAEILDTSFPELDSLVKLLKDHPKMNIAIHGHTDNQGTIEYNQSLSEARANAVHDYLIQKGINESRLDYKGFGEEIPVASNDTELGKSRNRRVEFLVK